MLFYKSIFFLKPFIILLFLNMHLSLIVHLNFSFSNVLFYYSLFFQTSFNYQPFLFFYLSFLFFFLRVNCFQISKLCIQSGTLLFHLSGFLYLILCIYSLPKWLELDDDASFLLSFLAHEPFSQYSLRRENLLIFFPVATPGILHPH